MRNVVSLFFFAPFLICQNVKVFAESSKVTELGNPLPYTVAYDAALKSSLDRERLKTQLSLAESDRKMVDFKNDFKLSVAGSFGTRATHSSGSKEPKSTLLENPNTVTLEQNYTAQASKPLYDFGRLDAEKEKVELSYAAKQFEERLVAFQLRYVVARAFARLESALLVAELAERQLSLSETKVSQMEKSYRMGLRSEADLIRSKVELGRANIAAGRAREEVILARTALHIAVMGERPQSNNTLSVVTLFTKVRPPSVWSQKLTQVNTAPARNLRLEQLDAEIKALKAELPSIEARQRPLLSGQGSVQLPGSLTPIKPVLGAQIQLSWDIPWNGMSNEERTRNALNESILRLQKQTVERSVQEREQLALESAQQIISRMKQFEDQHTLATRLKELVRNRYESGKASAFELSSAEDEVLSTLLELRQLNYQTTLALLTIAEQRGVENIHEIFQ